METIKIEINGRTIETEPGTSILTVATEAGIYIPSLCYHRDLTPLPEVSPDLSCQLCMVDINGKIMLSCDAKAADGMVIKTETEPIREQRRRTLTDILRRHPNACLTCWRREHCGPTDTCLRSVSVTERCVLCPANKRCDLQKATEHIGINELPLTMDKQLSVREDSPFFVRDNNLCINCRKCVRVCADVRQVNILEFAYPCHKACPAGIDIPRYIKAVGRNRPSTALAVIREKVPFPGVLGRVCIHPCEGECQRGKIAENPLQIRMIKRYAADHGDDSWRKLSKRLPSTGKKVAVVGAGPAGLTAAFYLAKLGHSVTIFESQPKPGGMMLLGIPEYRLPRDVLDSEINEITAVGVTIKNNSSIKAIDPLFSEGYQAVFIGLGAHQGQKLGVEGDSLPGVMESVEFLRRGNLGEKVAVGTKVGVVGGGNVAIDAARMALRFGAKEVTMFYRRTRAEMPAAAEEVEAALNEGIKIEFLTAPAKVTRENNTLKYFCTRMKLGEPDASGRPRPIPIENSEFGTELDTLLVAIGQRPDVPADMKVETARGNVIKVDDSMMTTHPGVFSAGDCVSGPASVIGAIAGGRKAAEAIDKYLGGRGDISESLVAPEEAMVLQQGDLIPEKLAKTTHLPTAQSVTSFAEVEQGWNEETALAEAQRCLRCNVITPLGDKAIQDANCQFCGACVDACPTGALMERSAMLAGPVQETVPTTCPYCGVGCNFALEVKNDKVINVNPLMGPANKGQVCVKGKFGQDFIGSPERLTTPLIRKNGDLVPASWDEAINLIATKLAGYKPDEVAVISSSRTSNEDNYVSQKFARAVLKTNNVDNCARV
jgi:formate dehydrogenase (NADP+) beta subunit